MLRTTPLVDKELSAHISAYAKSRMKDAEYKAQMVVICLKNAAKKKVRNGQMSRKAKELLAKRNAENNARYIEQRTPEVLTMLREKKSYKHIAKKLGMGWPTLKKIAKMNGI